MGGTAAGTGANASPEFRELAIEELKKLAGFNLRKPADPRTALQSHWACSQYSGSLKEFALEGTRIANDLRLLASGPMTGLGEILLPAVQPGSSIMPGKVNPSMLECLNMILYQILGSDFTVSLATQAGQLDLNVFGPVIIHNLLFVTQILINYLPVFREKCVEGIKADKERCRGYFEKSLSLAALLNPRIGYVAAAEVFKEALKRGKTVPEMVLEKRLLSQKELEELLDPQKVTGALDHD